MTGGDHRFDLLGDLPTGTVAIEASAGTGKTFALAALATRFIAEGRSTAAELLIVTFTRAATHELRGRVRDQLVEAAAHLHAHLAAEAPPTASNELLDFLVSTDQEARLDRVRRAIADFDAATVVTIHGFATQVRASLSSSALIDPDARLVDDADDVVADASADALAAATVGRSIGVELPTLEKVTSAAKVAVGRPGIAVAPSAGQTGADDQALELAALVERSRDLVADRRRRNGTIGFDDVLVQLSQSLVAPGSAGLVESVRGRYNVALIDEFQDTDATQWAIFRRLFAEAGPSRTLVLVGDPKQAIYSFRGADIHTYLEAVGPESGTDRRSLATNWRSDGALLRSLQLLFEGVTFGSAGIPFVAVGPSEDNRDRRMVRRGGEALPALSLRLATGPDFNTTTRGEGIYTNDAEEAINRDLVAHIRDLLDTAEIPTSRDEPQPRPLVPSDIAVLVLTAKQAALVQKELLRQAIPAVVSSADSVLRSPAAEQLRWLLHAMDRPSDPRRARLFALSWFGGWTAEEVDQATDTELAEVQERLAVWSEQLATHTVADVLARVWSGTAVVARVLRQANGDRNLTDLHHLAELCSASTPSGRASVAGLLGLLGRVPENEVDEEVDGDITARRVESEDQAVQIMTVWMAKGQEFPVVCVPSQWRNRRPADVITIDPDSGARTFDVTGGSGWPTRGEAERRKRGAEEELTGERLRLLYVALTRARHHTAVWWANAGSVGKTALARVLFARDHLGNIDPDQFGAKSVQIPSSDAIDSRFDPWRGKCPGELEVVTIGRGTVPDRQWTSGTAGADRPELGTHPFEVRLDRSRHRWSFSAITQYAAADGIDPSDPLDKDAGAGDERSGATGDGLMSRPDVPPTLRPDGPISPLAWLPAGTAFGTMVHAVLETVDFAASDVHDQVVAEIDRQMAWRSIDLTPVGDALVGVDGRRLLADGIVAALNTPLGPAWPGLSLRQLGRGDRLNELTFDLRLGGSGGHLQLREHRSPVGRPPGSRRCAGRVGVAARRGIRRHRVGRAPDRIDRPDLPTARPVGHRAVRGSGLQDQPADPPGPPPGDRRVPDGADGRGHGRARLPVAGGPVRRGASPLPAVAPARPECRGGGRGCGLSVLAGHGGCRRGIQRRTSPRSVPVGPADGLCGGRE